MGEGWRSPSPEADAHAGLGLSSPFAFQCHNGHRSASAQRDAEFGFSNSISWRCAGRGGSEGVGGVLRSQALSLLLHTGQVSGVLFLVGFFISLGLLCML